MLSIKPVGGTSTEVNYYAHLGEAENHDYYSEEGKRPGEWFGGAAKNMGLSGDVTPKEFKNLLEGLSPDGEKRLVQARREGQIKRRAGFDLTFSMPKSYSVAWSQTDRMTRSEMDEGARRALYSVLSTVEELCGASRSGKNGVHIQNAKLIAAIFSHDTARGIPGEAPDANRHFHAVVANVVIREDGTTGALDARPLFQRRMKMALGALFRAELSKELSELGFKTHRPPKPRQKERASWFELSCVPKRLMEAMSKRRAEIQMWLRERGLTGAKASERAALRTREGKENFSQVELFAAWRKLGAAHGFTKEQVKAARGSQGEFNQEKEKLEAVSRALSELISKKARFTEIELLELTAVEAQCRGLGIKEIREAVQSCLTRSEELVRLRDEKGVRTFTTKEMLQVEKRMLEAGKRLDIRRHLTVSFRDVQKVLSRYETLRAEQAEAIRAVTTQGDISCVQGVAGSGKTFMLGVAREVWEENGYQVLGTSLAAKASKGLEEGSGIKSGHVHKLLRDIERGEVKLDSKIVLVVDEAGMVGTRQMEKVVSLVESSGSKLVLVGDWDQLQAIDAGAAFRGIAESVGFCSMEEIVRQRQEWARGVVQDLRKGEAVKALETLEEKGRLFIGTDREEAIERLCLDFREVAIEGGELRDSLAFAGTGLEVRELNRRIQAERRAAGQLGEAYIDLDGFEVFLGDRVMVTRNNPLLFVKNGSLADVVGIESDIVSLRLEDGFTVEVDTREFDSITLGYAMTAHKGQGITCENAFILTGDGMTDREISYVEGSRAKGFTKMYSDVITGGESIQELGSLMNRSRQKELANEYVIEETG